MPQLPISLWQAVMALIMIASFCGLVWMLPRYTGYRLGKQLIARALLFVTFVAGGFLFMAFGEFGK